MVISERADFDERYFMLQRHSEPHLPPPRPDTLLETPPMLTSLPDMLDDLLDAPVAAQKPVHGGNGSTSSDLPSVTPASPPSPVARFETPASKYHSLPPSPAPSPVPSPSPAPQLLHLVPKASGVQGTSGSLSNGLSQSVIRSLESLHQLWSPQMKQTAILTTPLTSSKLVWPLHLNPHHTGSFSNALMHFVAESM